MFEEAEHKFTSTNGLKFLFRLTEVVLPWETLHTDKDELEQATQEVRTAHSAWSAYVYLQQYATYLTDLSDADVAEIIKIISEEFGEGSDIGYWAQKWHEPFTEDMARWACINHRVHKQWSAEHSPKGGYIYLLRSMSGYYKIGRSKNPDNRIKTFSVKLPFEVEYVVVIPSDDMIEFEKSWHDWFADKRVNGEWFSLTNDDAEFMAGYAS